MQNEKYSLASHNRPSKMKRISGCLWEVVAFKNRITGGLFREEVWALLLNAISKLCHVYFQVHVVYSKQHSAHSEHRDQRMCQVVTYKSLKTMENHSTFRPKKWSWSLTGGGKVLVFLIAVTYMYERQSLMGGGRIWKFNCSEADIQLS